MNTMCTDAQWMLKHGIIAIVIPSVHPRPYTENSNELKFIHKQELQLYEEYEEHKRNTIKAFKLWFDKDLLIDFKTDGR